MRKFTPAFIFIGTVLVVLLLQTRPEAPAPAKDQSDKKKPETTEFSQGERRTREELSGREALDGIPQPPLKDSASVSVQSLGPLPAEGVRVLDGAIGSCISAEELTLVEAPPSPASDQVTHADFAARSAEAAVAYARFQALRKMLANGDYITVEAGKKVPCPSAFTETVYYGFGLKDGREVDVVFLISHKTEASFANALDAYRSASAQREQVCMDAFNSMTEEGKASYLKTCEDIKKRLGDQSLPNDERQRLSFSLIPEQLEVRDGLLVRRR